MFLRFVLRCKSPRHLESPQGINWQLCFHHKINIRPDVCVHLIQSVQILEQFECRHHWVFWNLDYPKTIAILKFKNNLENKLYKWFQINSAFLGHIKLFLTSKSSVRHFWRIKGSSIKYVGIIQGGVGVSNSDVARY